MTKRRHEMPTLEEKVKKLPLELQKEVEEFVDSLAKKHRETHWRKPRFRWAGALKDLRDQYTSVELQHKIAEWRIGER
jgi:hypothetical protein